MEDAEREARQEVERHDELRISVQPLLGRLGLIDVVDERRSFVAAMDLAVDRVRAVAIECARFGMQQALAVVRSHYPSLNFETMGRGFPDVYSEEELDGFEAEVTPAADSLLQGVVEDPAFPFPNQ